MSDFCYHDDDPHPFEPEPVDPVCETCGCEDTSIYNSLTGYAWCCRTCKDGGQCECLERVW